MKSKVKSVGKDVQITGNMVRINGNLAKCLRAMSEKIGKPPAAIFTEALHRMVSDAKSPPKLEIVEHFDNGEGIALDDAGEVYRFTGDYNELNHQNMVAPVARCEKVTIPQALEWLATMASADDGSTPNYERFFKLLAVKLRNCPLDKPVRPVSELDDVASFGDSQLLTDGSGYFVTDGEKSARPVGLREALRWYSKRYLENDAEGNIDDRLWTDLLEVIATRLPEGV